MRGRLRHGTVHGRSTRVGRGPVLVMLALFLGQFAIGLAAAQEANTPPLTPAAGVTAAPPSAAPLPSAAIPQAENTPAPAAATPAVPPAIPAAPPAAPEPVPQRTAPPSPAAASPPAAPASASPSSLPHDLSPFGMFLAADTIVKAVMIGLAIASFMTWTVWLAKLIEIGGGRRRLRRELAGLCGERSLAAAAGSFAGSSSLVGRLIDAAAMELRLSTDVTPHGGLRDRVSSRLADIELDAVRRARLGTGLLASIGATAPFIGLFGTVWGIMNSFIGISKAQTTNLAVVAPGIAEALLATALGLVAAIPAVLFYNHLSRAIAAKRALIREAASEVDRLVSRDLDRSRHHGAPHLRSACAAE